MKRILAILDKDTDYAMKLAAYANERGLTPYSVIAFADMESFENFISRQPVDLLLNGTDTPDEEFRRLKTGRVIHLTDGGRYRASKETACTDGEENVSVCRYQSADRLFREVMEHCKSRGGVCSNAEFKSEVIGVCSPVGRCGKTGFAVTLGRILAEECKVMYLNMEECSGLSALTGTAYRRSLSDVIYALRQGNLDEDILGSAVYQLGDLDYVAPVTCFEDMEEIRAAELAELVEQLVMEEHYEVLILDIGNLGKNAFPLLERCGVIYAPVTQDAASQAKMAEWEKQILSYGGEDLLERVRLLHLPFPVTREDAENYYDSLLYGETGSLVRELLCDDER